MIMKSPPPPEAGLQRGGGDRQKCRTGSERATPAQELWLKPIALKLKLLCFFKQSNSTKSKSRNKQMAKNQPHCIGSFVCICICVKCTTHEGGASACKPVPTLENPSHDCGRVRYGICRYYTGCFFSLVPPKKLKYGKPRLGESTLT